MNNQRLLLIINPISGTSKKDGLADFVSHRLADSLGMDVDVKITGGKGDANRFASEAVEQGYYGVVAVGGDGTVNEVARALCNSDVALGIIPNGSGNGLARHLEIPVDVNLSLDVIAQNNILPCDYATVNDIPFFCTFGMGFDAAVSERFARQRKRGKMMYIKSAFEEFVKYRPKEYTIRANGKEFKQKAFLVACCNASQYGNNAYIAPAANMSDGLLDIIIIHAGSPISTVKVGVDLFTGYINHNTLIQTFQAPSAIISRTDPGSAHVDGDSVELGNLLDVKCHKEKLKIFVPQSRQGEIRPLLTPIDNVLVDLSIKVSNSAQKQNRIMRPIIGIAESFLDNARTSVANIPQVRKGNFAPVISPMKAFFADVRKLMFSSRKKK